MLRTSVCFVHQGRHVEYGANRDRVQEKNLVAWEGGEPFVEVDGQPIALTPELLIGWKQRTFGDAVRAYMQSLYPETK